MPRPYLIEQLLPARELSLLAGPSGSSKTTWLFQMLQLWEKGDPVHGHTSHPCPFVYLSIDRSTESAEETMERVGVKYPITSGVEEDIVNFTQALDRARKANPAAKLLIMDGFATLVPGGKSNDYNEVAKFLRSVTRHCKKHDVTVIGIVHASKTKENEKYLNPRERILGSVAWAAFSETIFFIAPVNPDKSEDDYRLLEILPRQARAQNVEFQLDARGRLVPSTRRTEMEEDLTAFLDKIPLEENFTVEELQVSLGIGRTKTYAVIAKLTSNFAIEKTKGGYRRCKSTFFPN